YAGNPNNNNGWIEADVPLLGELGAEAVETIVSPVVNEIAKPILEMDEQVIALVIDVEGDIAMLFGYGNSERFKDDEEVSEVNEEWLMAPVTPPPMLVVPLSRTYELVKKVIQVRDDQVEDDITIWEIGLKVLAVEGQVQVMASQMVQAMDRLEQVGAQVEQGL
nr:hypothetical protein [Tanacetum cinerariifolium]